MRMFERCYNYINNFLSNILNCNKIKFLSKQETANFIAEDKDKYIASLSKSDLIARRINNKRTYLIHSYNSAIDFTIEDKQKLIYASKEADKFLSIVSSKYISNYLITNIKWRFAFTYSKNYEYGLSHTRSNIIFLSSSIMNVELNKLIETLIHEKVHLYQRLYKTLFNIALFREGYRVANLRKEEPLIRANPDLDEYTYRNPSGVKMMYRYKTYYPSSIFDIEYNNNEQEHPYEEIAYNIATQYSNKNNNIDNIDIDSINNDLYNYSYN